MRPDEERRCEQHCRASQFQGNHQPASWNSVSEASDDAADGYRSKRLDDKGEGYKSGVGGCQIDRDEGCYLRQGVAKCGYPDRGYQAAECGIRPENSESRNAAGDLWPINNVQRL